MIRKAQVCFMFFAIMIIMVHAIIPHHHHRTIICFSSSDCQYEYYHHDHKNPEHHGKDAETEQREDCALQQLPTIPRSNVKQLITEYESFDNSLQNIKLDILQTDYAHILFFNVRSCFNVSFESRYTFLINSSLGLRAPPLV